LLQAIFPSADFQLSLLQQELINLHCLFEFSKTFMLNVICDSREDSWTIVAGEVQTLAMVYEVIF
jgi:hypothetical protein